MKRVRYESPGEMIKWAERHLPGITFRDDAQAIGLTIDDELRGVTIFDTFSPGQCHIHVVTTGRKWWSYAFAQHVAIHAFHTLKRRRVACIISADNKRAIRFARLLGCQLEGRLREAGLQGEDYLAFGLLRRECRYLPVMPLGALAKSA